MLIPPFGAMAAWALAEQRHQKRAGYPAHRKGSLEAGKDADLVRVDDQIDVHRAAATGRIMWREDS